MAKTSDNPNWEFMISQYLDDQLDPRQREQFTTRVREDSALAKKLQHYTSLQKHLETLGAAELEKVDFQAQRVSIMASLERKVLLEGRKPRLIIFRPAFLGALAAAAVFVMVAGVAFRLLTGPMGPGALGTAEIRLRPQPVAAQVAGEAVVQLRVAQLPGANVGPVESPSSVLPAGTIIVSAGPSESDNQSGYVNFLQFE